MTAILGGLAIIIVSLTVSALIGAQEEYASDVDGAHFMLGGFYGAGTALTIHSIIEKVRTRTARKAKSSDENR